MTIPASMCPSPENLPGVWLNIVRGACENADLAQVYRFADDGAKVKSLDAATYHAGIAAIRQTRGFDTAREFERAVERAEESGVGVPSTGVPFSWAHDLDEGDEPPREIVEDVLTAGGMSVVYGESNSGKSYLVSHLGLSIARGVPWLSKRVERGVVIYVAGEGATSIKQRVLAYQRHHGAKVTRFGIVLTSLNLLDPSADVQALTSLIAKCASEIGEPVQLVIVDTLARAMAGADENSGQDMGWLVRAGDFIREMTGAHILFVHHTGKDALRGARGHSSLRAALDTEIEVKADEDNAVHTIEITKQRDLSTKGLRLAGRFVPVEMGVNQWGKPISVCVVEDADAPLKSPSKDRRPSEVEGAIIEFLSGHGAGCLKGAIVKHFEGRYVRTSVYRAISRMIDDGMLNEVAGIVALPGAPNALSPLSPLSHPVSGDGAATLGELSPLSPPPYRGGDRGDKRHGQRIARA